MKISTKILFTRLARSRFSRTVFLTVSFLLSTFYLFSQGAWTQKSSFGGTARYAAAGFSIGNKGYIGTGYNAGSCISEQDFWEWDQQTDVWTQKATYGGAGRSGAVGFSIGTKGYIGIGSDDIGYVQDFWEWDQGTNNWTQKANFSLPGRYGASGFSIGNKGYIGVGVDATGYKQDFWEWDQATDSWTQKANFTGTGRSSAVGFSIGAKGYIGTGYDGSYKQDFWEWDQAANTWTQKAAFGGIPRESACGFSIGARGYIGTGKDSPNLNSFKKDFWEWDQATDKWTQKADLAGVARGDAVGFSIGSKGYIGTGQRGVILTQQDFWEYDPNVTGINKLSHTVSISVFPNPFSTQATFSLSKEVNDASLIIYDLSEKEVENINFSGTQVMVERGNLSSGTYFYQIVSDLPAGQAGEKNVSTGKLIIQ